MRRRRPTRRDFLKTSATAAAAVAVLPFDHELPEIDENELNASICRESFKEFVKEFWDVVIEEGMEWNWHMDVICDEMQEVAERVFKGENKKHDLIINVCPGSTKSTICSVMFPAWTWTRMASTRNICASFGHDLQLSLSVKTRDIVQSEKYQAYFPDITLRQDTKNKSYFINNHHGDRFSVGLRGMVTGFHGHFIIIDDPLDPEGAYSEAELLKSTRWFNQTLSSRKVNKNTAVVIMIMQRLNMEDPTGDRLKKADKDPVRWVCIPAEDAYPVHPPELRKHYIDGLMDPVRVSQEFLEREKLRGQYFYAGQFGQSPLPLAGGMFKTDKIQIDTPPLVFHRVVRFWDKAATHEDGCYTVGVKMGQEGKAPHQTYWILHVERGQWDSDARDRRVLQTAKMDGKRVRQGLEEEGGSSGKDVVVATAKLLAGYRFESIKPTGDKLVRADPFSAVVNAGIVKMAPGEWNQAYIDELKNCGPGAKYMDQVDASSGAFKMLTKPILRAGGFRT